MTARRSVFVSYARSDLAQVKPLARLLRAAGVVVFHDEENIAFGDDWAERLVEAISRAERVLVFWSRNSAASEWVRREYQAALAKGCRVVPILLDDTALPPDLSKLQALTDLDRFWKASTARRRLGWTGTATFAVAMAGLVVVARGWRADPSPFHTQHPPPPLTAPSPSTASPPITAQSDQVILDQAAASPNAAYPKSGQALAVDPRDASDSIVGTPGNDSIGGGNSPPWPSPSRFPAGLVIGGMLAVLAFLGIPRFVRSRELSYRELAQDFSDKVFA